jgi:hypothetical protein
LARLIKFGISYAKKKPESLTFIFSIDAKLLFLSAIFGAMSLT